MYFPDGTERHTRVYEQVLADLEVYFADDLEPAFLKQVIIGQDTTGNRIFDRHQRTVASGIVLRLCHYLAKGSAGNHPGRYPIKTLCRHLVERAFKTLNGYTLHHHMLCFSPCTGSAGKQKIPAFPDRDCM